MRCFGWLADTLGPGTIRVRLPLEELARHGHDTHASERWPEDWRDAEVVIGQRVSMPAPSTLWRAVCQRTTGPLAVYETDDDLLHVDPTNQIAYRFFGDLETQARHTQNLSLAHRVTVSTPRLAEVYRQFNADIRVVPNAVPDWLFDLPSSARTDGRVTVGYGASGTHDMDWPEVAPHLRRFLKRTPDAELHTIGPPHYGASLKVGTQWRHTPWFKRPEDYWRAIDFHIALAPLKPHVFNKAKSSIKALETAARGIPTIASDYGPYSDFVLHGETGFLVRQDHEWGRYLRTLTKDHDLREKMGTAAREHARAWSISKIAPLWEAALQP